MGRHAAEHDGSFIKGAGDGYWLEFPSAAIAMQEALRPSQLNRGELMSNNIFLETPGRLSAPRHNKGPCQISQPNSCRIES